MNEGKIVVLITFLFATELTFAQLDDNFSDRNFTTHPGWSGDQTKFIVNGGKLKLQAPAVAETAFLSTPSEAIYNGSWEFYLQMDFNPSSTNFTKIYLVSDQMNLTGSLNGYFIKAGNTSRDISLYRQNGLSETKIIDGQDDRLNIAVVKVKIKVTRSGNGVWQLYSDVGPTGNYFSEGIITDDSFATSSFFGVVCVYTSTRSDKFWFDDFVVSGSITPDTTPPVIQSVTTLDARQVRLLFSESIDPVSAQDRANYSLIGIGLPVSAQLQADHKTVHLTLSSLLSNGLTYSLLVAGVKDQQNNAMIPATVTVLYFKAGIIMKKDIIITEIFPDPSPQVGLPATEFLEIFNRSQNPVDLGGWKLSDGSSTGIFPSQIILPSEYRIITASSSVSLFAGFGKTIGLNNFPTLNNSGDAITLRNPEELLIDSVNYTLEWYRDDDKQEGGWTLELIDPENPCGEQDNWMASESHSGGTPGTKNSVWAAKPDLTGPRLTSVFPDSPSRIALTFDEKLDPSSVSPNDFIFQPTVEIIKSTVSDVRLKTIQLELGGNLLSRQSYFINVKGISDCAGNEIQQNSKRFGLSESPDSLDIVINEILFNPRSGGVDFVEVYNASPKFLNLKEWKLSNYDNYFPHEIISLFPENFLLAPESYLVFTSDPQIVKLQYPLGKDEVFFKAPIPYFPDDAGSVALLTSGGKVIDALNYSKSWHSVFIKTDEGVSLERISDKASSNENSNWNSASSTKGFATPGFANSQGRGPAISNESITIVPEIFTPDSGTNNFAEIQYHFDRGGCVANVNVYDQQGHHLRTLANNEVLGPEGFFRWDGDRDDGSKARMGYYLVWFEVFDATGIVNTYLKRVVVTSK